MTALRNHQSVLKPYIDCDLIPLEELISPSYLKANECQQFLYRISKKTKIVFSIDKMLPYGENIIFGAFGPVHEGIIKRLCRLGIRPSFMWCSTLGQMELTPNETKNFMRFLFIYYLSTRFYRFFLGNQRNQKQSGDKFSPWLILAFFPFDRDGRSFKHSQTASAHTYPHARNGPFRR